MQYLARVATPSGEILERAFDAENEEALRRDLSGKGYYIFKIRAKTAVRGLPGLRRRQVVDQHTFLMFNHELATLLKAGLPVLQSLEILLERLRQPVFREALKDIREQVKSGTALSDAFMAHPSLFPPLYCSSLKAGERSGDLEGVIRRYIRYAKVIEAVRKRVTSAMIYPSVLIVLSWGVVFVLLTYAIPKFADLFSSFGRDLPLLTQILVAVSGVVSSYAWLIILALVGGVVGLKAWSQSPGGRARIDKAKLRVPFLGHIWQKFAISQLTRALATLLGGGIPLVSALETAALSVSNSLVSNRMKGVVSLIREGQPLSHAMESTGLVTAMVIDMVRVGESTGALAEMLTNVADYYDEEVERDLDRVVTLIEPALLVVMGSIIAVMLMAMYLPIFELQSVSFH